MKVCACVCARSGNNETLIEVNYTFLMLQLLRQKGSFTDSSNCLFCLYRTVLWPGAFSVFFFFGLGCLRCVPAKRRRFLVVFCRWVASRHNYDVRHPPKSLKSTNLVKVLSNVSQSVLAGPQPKKKPRQTIFDKKPNPKSSSCASGIVKQPWAGQKKNPIYTVDKKLKNILLLN